MPTLDSRLRGNLAWLTMAILAALGGSHASAGEVRSFPLPYLSVLAEEITAEAPVLFRAMRFNEATEQWNVDLVVTNQGERSFNQALFLTVEGFSNTTGPVAFDGASTNPPVKSFIRIDLGGVLAPGRISPPRTIALGFVEGAGAPRLQMRVFGVPFGLSYALALTRSLNEAGQPLAGVRVTERGPIEDRLLFTDPDYGVVTLGQSQGEHTWKFEQDGHLPVWRKETLLRGAVRLVSDPRLVRRNTNSTAISASGNGIVTDPAGNVRLEFSFEQPGDSAVVTLTVVDGQTLPGPLPQGWSPLRAFWVESTNAPLAAVVAMKPEGSIAPSDTAALVKWNVDTTQWQVQARLTGEGTNETVEILENWGAYALVVADSGSLAPPTPVSGQPLLPSTPPPQPAPAFAASGSVTPSSSPASRVAEQVTATASVLITNSTGLLPSGLTLRTEVTEDYRLQDSSTRFTASYETFVAAYRRPAGTSPTALNVSFPMRPLLLFGGDELTEASVRVDVLPPDIFRGGVFDSFGGGLTNNRVRISGAPGDFATPQAALLRTLGSTNLPSLLIPGQSIAAAFELTVAGIEAGRSLSLQVSNLAPNRFFVLSRILSGTSFNGLEPVERLRSGTNGALDSLEPSTGERLPGLRGAGQYLLVQVSSPHGLISGITRNAQSQPASALPIRVTGQPWLTFSASNGAYRLVAPTGAVQVAATDLASGDTDFVDSTLVDPNFPVALDLGTRSRGPRVASVTPPANARNVSRVTPIVVALTEPVNPVALLNKGLQLLGSNGLPVTASLTLNQRGTIATLLPVNPLAAGQAYVLMLSTNIASLNGRRIEGATQFSFTTAQEPARGDAARLTIFQPGATNLSVGNLDVRPLLAGFNDIPDKRNTIVAYGSPGTAEGEVPVILVNESSGETATVLSKVDGSFAGFLHASEEDFISAVFVNANGTRTTVPASLQRFDDGRQGLYRQGGILEAQSDGGPVQVIVEPGAIESRTLFRIDPLTPAQFSFLVSNTPPAGGGRVVGGFNYTETGDPLTAAADIAFPVSVGSLGLPANLPPEQATYAVVTPHNFGGTIVYEVVDRADFESTGAGTGRIVTRSPPFVGLLAQSLAQIRENIGIPDLSAVVTQTATEQNPHKGESGAFGIIALPFSQGVTVGGRVVSLPVDGAGNPSGPAKPVPGALVRLEQEQAGVLATVFSAGELLAGADLNGNFGFVLRPSGAGNSFNLVATHPRFPFQRARATGLTPPANATTALRAELRFSEINANAAVTGTQPPEVQVSHVPLLPAVGLGDADGALITVVALDDRQVAAPTLELVRVESPNREFLNLSNARPPSLVLEQRTAPGRVSRQFRVKAAAPSRVILKASAADDSGHQRQVDYTVLFGGVGVGTGPGDPNDIRGPRVIFSWPPQMAPSIPARTPIVVRFNEPIPEGYLASENLSWLSFDPTHFLRSVEASTDRREIIIRYEGRADNEVRLNIGAGLTDASQNPFDQNPVEPGPQSFDLAFSQQSPRTAELTDSASGGGAAFLGRYAYALDRSGGRLLSYDLDNPSDPELQDTLALEGFLATLTPVPELVLPKNIVLSGGHATADGSFTNAYVAVFTGGAADAKQLRLVSVADGDFGNAQTGTLTVNPAAQIVKSKWDPPFMGYFELGADLTSISLINLTAFDIATRPQFSGLTFPAAGDAGLDANSDGSFCDTGDRLPLPSRRTDEPPGLAFSYAPADAQERIQDFDFDSGLGLVVATHMPIGAGGQGNLRVVLAAASSLSLNNAIVKFDVGLRPKRVTLLAAQLLQVSNSFVSADIALVSLTPEAGGDGRLAVIDLSNPAAPTNRNLLFLPGGEGSPGSIQRRADGLLGLATSGSVLLIDPTRLLLPEPLAGTHPAFVGRVSLPAGGVRDFVADATGVNMIFSGGSRRVVQTEPHFQLVRFNQVVDPTAVSTNTSRGIDALLRSATPVNLAEVTKVDFGSNAPPAMDPERHYYVIVDAPGGVGDKLPLVLAAVDERGQPQRDLNRGVVPVIVGDEAVAGALLSVRVTRIVRSAMNAFKAAQNAAGALQGDESLLSQFGQLLSSGSKIVKQLRKAIGELEKIFALFPRRFTAVRLSNNPDDPLYNRFLAGPFIVLGGMPREAEAKSLVQQWADFKGGAPGSPVGQDNGLNRAYIRPSPRLWVGLPSLPETPVPGFGDPVLEPFHSKFRLHPTLNFSGITLPPVSRLVDSLASDTVILGPLALTLLNTLPVVNAEIQPTILPGAHQLVRVNFAERPLVFVPGFAGSSIEVEGNEFWLALSKIYNRTREELLMNPNGTPAHDSRAKDALRYTVELPVLGGLGSIYGTWLNHLADEVGYVEYDYLRPPPGQVFAGDLFERRRRLDQDPNLSQYPLPNLYVFPYDWRRDNQDSANLLKEYVRIVIEMHPDADGIDLVGHSNGGLVSRAYMLLPGQRQLVRRFITVGTPWLGSPKILAGLKTGNVNELSLNVMLPIPALQATLQLSPAAHQLLPTREYFDLGFRPLVEDGFDINGNGVSHEFYNFDQYMNALEKDFLRKPLAQLVTNLSVHPAKANHLGFFASQPISDHKNEPPGTEFHHIFGFGAVPDTIGQVRVVGRLIPAEKTTNVTLELPAALAFESDQESSQRLTSGKPGDGFVPITDRRFRLNEEVEVRFVCGDGTVPIGSLSRGFGSSMNLNAPQARVYPLIGAADEITGHNPMLNTDSFLELFDNLLVGRTVEQLQITVNVQGAPVEGSVATLTVQANSGPGIGTDLVNVVVDFGDGGSEYRRALSGSQVTLQHRYRQSGDYLVSVGALNDTGLSGFRSRRVSVNNAAPQVSIQGGDITVSLGETRVFIADVNDPGLEDSHTFHWEGPETSVDAGRQFAMPFTFQQPGSQTVKVTVTDSDGATGAATVNVNVLPTPPSGPVNPPVQPASFLAAAAPRLNAFEGGQPELFVRVSGHAPGLFGTTGLSARDSTITLVTSAADAVFDLAANLPVIGSVQGSVQESLATLFHSVLLPRVARFLGLMAKDAEYARFVRSPPPDDFLGVVPTQLAQVAAASAGQPMEVDMLYLEGGVAKFLSRYSVTPATNGGVRLTFNWTELTPTLAVVTPGTGGSLLDGVVVSNVPSRFDAFGEQKAADRQGPVVVGVANAFSGRIELFTRDNFTASTNIAKLLAWDSNGDGRLDDEIFYEVPTNTLERVRLPSRPFAIVGADEHCNVGDLIGFCPTFTGDFRFGERSGETNTYENRLTAIRAAVRGAINDARSSAAVRRFLAGPNPMWFLEQGSGAGLWKINPVAACNGLYRPGFSDNDYEVFFPVHLASNFTFTAAGRAAFLSMNPYAGTTASGDWYFVRPTPADQAGFPVATAEVAVTWRYEIPAPFTNSFGESFFLVDKLPAGTDPALGYPDPLTPAEAITRLLVRAVTSNPARRQLLPDINFFPERREHFMFGAMHLQRPPLFGDDPIGDSGTGRQMLLLKWLLEGAYVSATDGGPAGTLSPGAPLLADVYQNWELFGVPLAEGAEWGFFQEWAALMAKPLLDTRTRYALAGVTELNRCLDDAISASQKQKIKKLGKAAIRGALARLAGDPGVNGLLTNITFQSYQGRNLRSYEDFILTTILESGRAEQIFGAFATPRDDLTEGPDLRDFLRAKNGDESYLSTVAFAPGAYQRFVYGVFDFLRMVQTATVPSFLAYTVDRSQQGGLEEVSQRISNLRAVLDGNAIRHGVRDLSTNPESERFTFFAAAANYAEGNGGNVSLVVAPQGAASQTVDSTQLDAHDSDTFENGAVDLTLAGGMNTEATVAIANTPASDLSASDNKASLTAATIPVPPNTAPLLQSLMIVSQEDANGPVRLLEDWPADGPRPRSARHLLTTRSRIQPYLIASPGLGLVTLTVNNPSRNQTIMLQMAETGGSGIYTLAGPRGFIPVTDNRSATDALYLKDEDIVDFSVQAGPVSSSVSLMLDRLERAAASLQFAPSDPRGGMLPDFVQVIALYGFGDSGTMIFDDDVAVSGSGLLNEMGRFIMQAGTATDSSGESDWLFVNAHGDSEGTLFQHAQPRDPVLMPGELSDQAFWNQDVDWIIIHACRALNNSPSVFDEPVGVQEWLRTLRRAARPPHGILGFQEPIGDLPANYDLFLQNLEGNGLGMVPAWKKAMEGSLPQPWMAVFYESARDDKLLELSQDPVQTDPIQFEGLNVPTTTCRYDVTNSASPSAAELQTGVPSSRLISMYPLRLFPLSPFAKTTSVESNRFTGALSRKGESLHQKSAPTRLTETEATRRADEFLATTLPAVRDSLRFTVAGSRVAGEVDAQGNAAVRTFGHVIYYEHVVHGIPVEGDFVSVEVADHGIGECVARLHEARTAQDQNDHRVSPLPLSVALEVAKPAILQRYGGIPFAIERQALKYVHRAGLGNSTGDEYVAAWCISGNLGQTEGGGASGGAFEIRVNATTGELLPPSGSRERKGPP